MARTRSQLRPADKPDSIQAVIAAQVELLRRQHGWSQADLAKKLDFSTSVVQQLETGSRSISVEELLRLAFTLDVSPTDLIAASFLGAQRVPLFGGRRFPRREVRAWVAGEPKAALRGMDERRYREQISADDYLAGKRVAGLVELQETVNQLRRDAARGERGRDRRLLACA